MILKSIKGWAQSIGMDSINVVPSGLPFRECLFLVQFAAHPEFHINVDDKIDFFFGKTIV